MALKHNPQLLTKIITKDSKTDANVKKANNKFAHLATTLPFSIITFFITHLLKIFNKKMPKNAALDFHVQHQFKCRNLIILLTNC